MLSRCVEDLHYPTNTQFGFQNFYIVTLFQLMQHGVHGVHTVCVVVVVEVATESLLEYVLKPSVVERIIVKENTKDTYHAIANVVLVSIVTKDSSYSLVINTITLYRATILGRLAGLVSM